MRAVSKSAGTNVGAVSYHFGSREALLAEVVASASAPVLEAQRRLDALEQVRRRLLGSGLRLGAGRCSRRPSRRVSRPSVWARSSDRLSRRRAATLTRWSGVVADADERFLRGLARSSPDANRLISACAWQSWSPLSPGLRPRLWPHLAKAGSGEGIEDRVLEILTAIATAST